MSIVLDGTSGLTTPGVVNTAGETIATTLAVSGTVSVTQATGNNFDAGAVVAKNVLTLGSSGSNYGFVSNVSSDKWSLSYGTTKTTLGTSALDWTATGVSIAGNLLFNSGYGSAATAYGCRAWVNFNGTGTVAIRASGNVSSITDGGTGTYTVNFTTAIVDANYAAASLVTPYIAGNDYRYFTFVKTQTTSNVAMQCNQVMNGVSATDAELVAVAIFR